MNHSWYPIKSTSNNKNMKLSYVLIAAVLLLSACTKTRKAPNGFEMTVVREGKGEYAKPLEYLVVNLVYKDSKDSVWDDSRRRDYPMIIQVADTSAIKREKGMESSFRVLRKGDSVTLKVTAKSFFENTWGQQVPPNVKPETEITFNLGVADILDQEGIGKLQAKMQAEDAERNRKLAEGQLALDTVAIDNYLSEKKIIATKDKSGLRYVVTKQGSGVKPTLTNTIKVNYRGTLLADGQVFDQSQAPIEYALSNFIPGWQIGFPLLSKGSKAVFYIPSALAYGAAGSPPRIPANANLVFEVELIDVK
jgi:FKBP-type peptidyl-prolyl cis-trans isomerase FkpA